MQEMSAVAQYVKDLQGQGRYHFTTEDAVRALGGEHQAITRALKRLVVKRELARPQRSFYVIVPPEYKVLGCLPAARIIPTLI